MKTLVYTSYTLGPNKVSIENIFYDLLADDIQLMSKFFEENEPSILSFQEFRSNKNTHLIIFRTEEAYQKFLSFPQNLINVVQKFYSNQNVIDFMSHTQVEYDLYYITEKETILSNFPLF